MDPTPPSNAALRIGISGWRYAPWRGVFYPKGLVQARELEFASRQLPTIELNGSFYSLQRPKSYREWHDATPEGFVFAVKGSRYITHLRRLRDVETPLANFFASGVLALGDKLGPFLWQFPPRFRFDAERFARFLDLLPADLDAAQRLAARHEDWMRDRALTRVPKAVAGDGRLRHAVEVRDMSFVTPELVALLARRQAALVVADTAGKWPYCEDVTADFMYLRLHGDAQLYASGYGDAALDRWAARIRAWGAGGEPADAHRIDDGRRAPAVRRRDVYCYFDNDAKVHAPFDARHLMERLDLPLTPR